MGIQGQLNRPYPLRYWNKRHLFKIGSSIATFCLFWILFSSYPSVDAEQVQTQTIVQAPQINDILFIDNTLMSDKFRPHEKYRLAKVVDITGNVVTIVYGSFYYKSHFSVTQGIRFGQLSYNKYFEPQRHDLTLEQLSIMQKKLVIYAAKRPKRNELFGRVIANSTVKYSGSQLTYGRKENLAGEAYLASKYSELSVERAFDQFLKSAKFGYPEGQVNLAEMYINGIHTERDFHQALHWLKQASLQSFKPAIYKYIIICKQVEACNLTAFYQELIDNGVKLTVRDWKFELDKESTNEKTLRQ